MYICMDKDRYTYMYICMYIHRYVYISIEHILCISLYTYMYTFMYREATGQIDEDMDRYRTLCPGGANTCV